MTQFCIGSLRLTQLLKSIHVILCIGLAFQSHNIVIPYSTLTIPVTDFNVNCMMNDELRFMCLFHIPSVKCLRSPILIFKVYKNYEVKFTLFS